MTQNEIRNFAKESVGQFIDTYPTNPTLAHCKLMGANLFISAEICAASHDQTQQLKRIADALEKLIGAQHSDVHIDTPKVSDVRPKCPECGHAVTDHGLRPDNTVKCLAPGCDCTTITTRTQ